MSKPKLSLKWFGSISNLSIHRSSVKTDPKITSNHGSKNDTSLDETGNFVHSPGYARSSDMYTHVGTVPRKEKQKSCKASKKLFCTKKEISRGPSQCQDQDYVRDSPLLGVLTGAHQAALEKPLPSIPTGKTLPVVQTASRTPSPFCDTEELPFCTSSFEKPKTTTLNRLSGNQDASLTSEDCTEVKEVRTGTNPCVFDSDTMPISQSTQYHSDPAIYKDMYVAMDIAGVVNSHLGKKRLENDRKTPGALLGIETLHSHLDPMDGKGEYVKFSKDHFWLDLPCEKLRSELEEELKVSSSRLVSHGWYHGHIPWQVSEMLVLNHGDFLIRDSLSSRGDYVLTSRWNHKTLHFLIRKVLIQKSEPHPQVQFTLEGETFSSVPALVHFYIGNRVALTQQSGAQIHCPVNRTLPLHCLETAFALANHKGCLKSPSCQRGALVKSRSGNGMDICLLSPSALHHREAVKSSSLSLDQIVKIHQPSPTQESPLSLTFTTQQVQSPQLLSGPALASPPSVPRHSRRRDQLCPSPLPSLENKHLANQTMTPAQESPILRHLTTDKQQMTKTKASVTHSNLNTDAQQTLGAQASSSYSTDPQQISVQASPDPIYLTPDNSCLQACPAAPAAHSYVERLCGEEEGLCVGHSGREDNGNVYEVPTGETASAFRPSQYQSPLMPRDNRPLEVRVLRRVKELLVQVDAQTLAKHITKADCTVARILNVTPEMQKKMGVSSGIELLTLPHGHQLRLDLLERFQTMSLMLAVDILGCTGSADERAALLHKTIEMAAELKSTLGNMFGFAAIMRTLEMPQISRLEQTWQTLRQRHTDVAILYEKTLKPFMKRMNEGKESCALANTSFPHVVPLLSLLEKSVAVVDGTEPWDTVEAGLDVVMNHLETARTTAQQGVVYRSNAENKLKGFQEQAEVLELFLTEFEMRLLWGNRGAEENQAERYAKFDQVLSALSNRLEPPIRHSEL
ncbi:hypothetical protein UPYG_G00187200 [Umbra pygmaea]|uniref:SH2 domain-containing protein 3C n=1 Tax=Umbra pygmaea TaxID=75934 RepID=A0ABD0WSP2_UMBPY